MQIEVDLHTDDSCQKVWVDRHELPLEKQLNDFLKGLIVIAEERKKTNFRWAKEDEIRRQKEELKLQKKKEAEEKAFKNNVVQQLAKDYAAYKEVQKLQGELGAWNSSSEEMLKLKAWVDEYLLIDPVERFIDLNRESISKCSI